MTTAINPLSLTETGTTFAEDLAELSAALGGSVVLPEDADYDELRQIRNASIDRRPAVIVRARDAEDVALAVRFARRQGLTMSVRSGGHSFAGHSVNDRGVVIDLRLLNNFSIDPVTKTARVQPGVTSGQLGPAAQEHGLALSTGDTSSVGIGGLTLGGGIGWLVRSQGLTIDSLLSAEVVTADGEILRASAWENEDLFWALRGGGGNFGIVTEFEFQLHETGIVLAGMVALPPTPEVLRKYAKWASEAPDELTTIGFLMSAPPAPFVPEAVVGKPVFVVIVCRSGEIAAGEADVAALRGIAEPLFEMVAPMPYPAIYAFTEEATKRAREYSHSQFMDELPDEVIEACVEAIKVAPGPLNMIQVRPLGGAMARVPVDATAFAHRKSNYLLAVIGSWMEHETGEAATQWAKDLFAKVREHGNGTYVNFLHYETDRLGDAYPRETLSRLEAIKGQYDPENVFSMNQNIRPAGL